MKRLCLFSAYRSQLKPDHYYNPRSLATSPSSPPPLEPLSPGSGDTSSQHSGGYNGGGGFKTILGDHPPLSNSCQSSLQSAEHAKGKRGRPRKHAIKIPLPPLYVFIRNLLHNRHYNPRVITWVSFFLIFSPDPLRAPFKLSTLKASKVGLENMPSKYLYPLVCLHGKPPTQSALN